MIKALLKSLIILTLVTGAGATEVDSSLPVYLTWQGDTARTMTVNFALPASASEGRVLYGRRKSQKRSATGKAGRFPGRRNLSLYHIELKNLRPNTRYYFTVGSKSKVYSRQYSFRTLPADSRPLRFIVGGDTGVSPALHELFKRAAEYEPRFMVIGGDIAYANGKLSNVLEWEKWFIYYRNSAVRRGVMIPLVMAIGNHEVRGRYDQTRDKAPFFYAFFPQAGKRSYFARKYGKNLLLLIMDSSHTAPFQGAQSAWLKKTLRNHHNVPYRIAAYHIPLYPAHRKFRYKRSKIARRVWEPIFDSGKLDFAFEHHDHVFKRTHPIKNGQLHPRGVVYFGDGCMGKSPRSVDAKRWYLKKARAVRHFWVVDVTKRKFRARAIDERGGVLDDFQQARR